MNKAYKFRIYPNKEQKVMFSKTFGCTRMVYNYYLEKNQRNLEKLVKIDKFFASSQLCGICGYQNSDTKVWRSGGVYENSFKTQADSGLTIPYKKNNRQAVRKKDCLTVCCYPIILIISSILSCICNTLSTT